MPEDGNLRFGDRVCVYNSGMSVNLSINMQESNLHEAEAVSGPCATSGSKILRPCIRNVFVITG